MKCLCTLKKSRYQWNITKWVDDDFCLTFFILLQWGQTKKFETTKKTATAFLWRKTGFPYRESNFPFVLFFIFHFFLCLLSVCVFIQFYIYMVVWFGQAAFLYFQIDKKQYSVYFYIHESFFLYSHWFVSVLRLHTLNKWMLRCWSTARWYFLPMRKQNRFCLNTKTMVRTIKWIKLYLSVDLINKTKKNHSNPFCSILFFYFDETIFPLQCIRRFRF